MIDPDTAHTLIGRILPFGTIDCFACGSPGWYELHAVVWQPEVTRAWYAIVYLYSGQDGSKTAGRVSQIVLDIAPASLLLAEVAAFDGNWMIRP